MIKGILALFTSGIIFRLPVLCGVVVGFYMMLALSDEQIWATFQKPLLYVFGLIVCMIYAFVFKKVYRKGGSIVDWRATVNSLFGHFFSYIMAVVFSCLFIFAISFGGFDNDEQATDINNPQISEILNSPNKSEY